MVINVERESGLVALEIAGRLDATTAPNLDKTVIQLCEDARELVFDISALEYISSAGIRVLLKAYKKMNVDGSMRIIGASKMVREVFEMTGLLEMLEQE